MEKPRQLPARAQADDGGPVDLFGGIVRDNAEEAAARRIAQDVDRAGAAKREARQRRRQLRRTLRDIGYISAGAGVVLLGQAITGMCPWWIGVAALLIAQAMFYVARRL